MRFCFPGLVRAPSIRLALSHLFRIFFFLLQKKTLISSFSRFGNFLTVDGSATSSEWSPPSFRAALIPGLLFFVTPIGRLGSARFGFFEEPDLFSSFLPPARVETVRVRLAASAPLHSGRLCFLLTISIVSEPVACHAPPFWKSGCPFFWRKKEIQNSVFASPFF